MLFVRLVEPMQTSQEAIVHSCQNVHVPKLCSITMHMSVPSVLPRELLLFHIETFVQSSKVAIIQHV